MRSPSDVILASSASKVARSASKVVRSVSKGGPVESDEICSVLDEEGRSIGSEGGVIAVISDTVCMMKVDN